VPDWQFTCVNVEAKWAQANRDVVVRFLRALQRGRDYMRTNPTESARIAAEELRTTVPLSIRMLGDVESYGMLDPQTGINVEGLRRIFETLQKSGDISLDKKFELAIFVDFDYWQASHPDADPPVTASVPGAPTSSVPRTTPPR
jgi:ABC-type nitrate/sulfonate/bicarbonate transport system substrate-binding protein